VSATPEAVPAAPTAVSATAGANQAAVSWTAPSTQTPQNPITYSVYASANGGSYTQVVTGVSSTSTTVTGLTADISYTFEVTAADSYGQTSVYSSASGAVTPTITEAVYVANDNAGTVSAISVPGNSTLATISGFSSPIGIAATPNGQYVYVGNQSGNTVVKVATATNTVVGSPISVPDPTSMAVSPNGQYLYVTNWNNGAASSVYVINTSTNTLATGFTNPIPVEDGPCDIAFTPNGNYAYVDNYYGASGTTPGTVSVISTATNTVTATITVGNNPSNIAMAPNGQYVYTTNYGSGTVSVISTSSNAVTSTVTVGSGPYGIAVGTSGQYVYVANRNSNTVSVINTSNNAVSSSLTVGTNPAAVVATSDGSYVYVTNLGATPGTSTGTISVIATATNTVTAGTANVGTGPYSATVSGSTVPPGNLTTSTSSNQATLTWDAVPTATSYTVYQCTSSCSTPPTNYVTAPSGSGLTAATYSEGGLVNGTTYTFYVTASGPYGTSALSSTATAVVNVTVPGAPTSVTANPKNSQVTVSWTAPTVQLPDAIASYTVWASANGGSYLIPSGGSGVSGTSVTLTGLTNGTRYTFEVTVTDTYGQTSAASAPSSNFLADSGPNNQPLTQGGTINNVSSPFGTAFGQAVQYGTGCTTLTCALNGQAGATNAQDAVTGSAYTFEFMYELASTSSYMTIGRLSDQFYLTGNSTYGWIFYWWNSGGTATALSSGPGYWVAGTLDRVAVTWNGSTWSLFVNGTLVQTSAATSVRAASASDFLQLDGAAGDILDEVRASNSVRYTATYIPSTVPFSSDANTDSLYHFDTGVTPEAAPAAPTGVTATAGNAQATVSWALPRRYSPQTR